MNTAALSELLQHIKQAAIEAISYVDGLSFEEFSVDRRTQKAVVYSLQIIGEASARIMDKHPEYSQQRTEIPWLAMRGMRNRIVHGYFKLDLEVVWKTVHQDLPELIAKLDQAT